MKTTTTTLEGKLDPPVPQWIEPKVWSYWMNMYFKLLACVTFKVLGLVNIFRITFNVTVNLEDTSVDIMSWIGCGA